MCKKQKIYNLKENSESQLFLLGGIIIVIAIITIGIAATSLPDTTKTVDKESFIMSRYENIRKEFGKTLKDNIGNLITEADENRDPILDYFNNTRDIFIYIAFSNGNYLDVDFIRLTYKGSEPNGLVASLSFSNGKEIINEEVRYNIV